MKIHLGCGPDIRGGWLNLDMGDNPSPDYLKHDLRDPLPDSITNIELCYSSHLWEHLPYDRGISLAKEVLDKMIPGGVMRICWPDFRKTAQAYIDGNLAWFDLIWNVSPNQEMMEFVNFSLYQYGEHVTMLDPPFLIRTLERVGYGNCRQVSYDPAIDPACPVRQRYSSVVEGVKPAR